MIHILDIAQKDLLQLVRDRKVFMFLLMMPIVFTLLFGFAFGGFSSGTSDSRLPVGWLDQDSTRLSKKMHDLTASSEVIRLVEPAGDVAGLEQQVAENKIAAAIVVPEGYSRAILDGKPAKVTFIGDTSTSAGMSIESEVIALSSRLDSAARIAIILEDLLGSRASFNYALQQTLTKWQDPPIAITETTSSILKTKQQNDRIASLAHTSPGMMLQFAIAGLLTSAQVIVAERKGRVLQRLLTTATRRIDILLGHYLAIYSMIFSQFIVLLLFGTFVLGINYMREPVAVLVVAASAAACIAALGLLIGVLAQNEDQAVMFSLVPMFAFAGLGGAWVPLEVTGEAFQVIGHFTPVAWAMDGFKNISIRGLGIESVLIPAGALIVYAVVFFAVATWRLERSEER